MKKKTKILGINLLISLTLSALVSSCQWVTIEVPSINIPDDEEVSFVNDIQPIFDAKCTGCHGVSSPAGGLDLTPANSFNNIIDGGLVDLVNPNSSVIYTKPAPTGTHVAKYSNEQAAYVLKWIEDGALNDAIK